MNPHTPIEPEEGFDEFLKAYKKDGTEQQVPEAYFEQLPGRIMSRIREQEKSHAAPEHKKGRTIHLNLRYWMGAAAVIAVLLSGLLLLKRTGSDQLAMDQLSDEEVISYLEKTNLSVDLLAEAIEEPSVKETNRAEDSSHQEENYLIENIDEELIIEEL